MHSLDAAAAAAGAGELEALCARIELCRRKGLLQLAETGIRSGVLREEPEQRSMHRQAVNWQLLAVKLC